MLSALILPLVMLAKDAQALPSVIMQDVEYGREMCRAARQKFTFDEDYIEQTDFNGDGTPDFIIDTRGFECGKLADSLYGSDAGRALHVYLSDGKGAWKKEFSAYVYEYHVQQEYGEMPFLDVWVRGEVGYNVNYIRNQWNGDEFEVMEQEFNAEVPTQLWKQFD